MPYHNFKGRSLETRNYLARKDGDGFSIDSLLNAILLARESFVCPSEGFEWHLSPETADFLTEYEPVFGGINTILFGIPVAKIEPLGDGLLYFRLYYSHLDRKWSE
jgi:hypothetical protein